MTNLKCENCGLVNSSGEEKCKRCGTPLAIVQEVMRDDPRTTDQAPAVVDYQRPGYRGGIGSITKSQGNILIALVCIGIVVSAWAAFMRQPKYEYKVIRLMAESNERTGSGAMRYSSIQITDKDLASIGAEGWELVGTFLEMETAFPNFGKEEYVTGLQPNVRPQSAVLLFKRLSR